MMNLMAPALALILAAAAGGAELEFDRMRIGEGTYEAASIVDINNDGAEDIVSGEYWYPGPEFQAAHKICDIRKEQDYYDDFSNYPMDVNGDGWTDIVTGGWWGQTLQWRENPKGKTIAWKTHDVAKVGNIERCVFHDMDGDGTAEVFPTTKPVYMFQLIKDENGRGTGKFRQYVIDKGTGGHGFGAGDVNGDGRTDLLLAGGWLECPQDPFDVDAWTWRPEFNLGSASVPILVHDVNSDGKSDLIVGCAHCYGLSWYAQGIQDGKRTWTEHKIDPDRSQYHDMRLVDIDKDGEVELITGKRYRAHVGHDPGADDPVGIYYFEINGGDFVRHTIDYGAPDAASGAGIYFWVDDIDGNGWLDIAAPGKEGLYLFKNQGPAKS